MSVIFRKKQQYSHKVVITDRNGDPVKEGDQVIIHFPDKPDSPGILYDVLNFNKAIPVENKLFPPVDLSFIKKERILLW